MLALGDSFALLTAISLPQYILPSVIMFLIGALNADAMMQLPGPRDF